MTVLHRWVDPDRGVVAVLRERVTAADGGGLTTERVVETEGSAVAPRNGALLRHHLPLVPDSHPDYPTEAEYSGVTDR